MKFVKRPVSLPQKLARWAQAKVKREARERQQQPNFSAYIAGLIAEDQARVNGKGRAA